MRRKTETKYVVQEEVVQFVRADQVFSLLRDLTVFGRQKFRTDRRVKHIHQYTLQCLVIAGVRVIADQMADQGLRHGAVDCVHGHMVSIVGCPSESKFGEISGSYNDAAGLVCQVHQHLGALSCLGILVRDICHFRIMSDV